eukprot:15454068-Alexandrium_andersonii.AAC.1
MQSAIRPMLVSAPIRLDPQSAMRKVQHRFRRSSLELHGPRNGLKSGPRSSRRGAFCAVVRADSESARESWPRGSPMSRNRQLA